MTLRTPRRRISPRAKRRYRVIRDFFRRALGSSSQQDIKINSSIAVNVTDLKHKIVGIEHQLNEVSRHCQDLACIESTIRKGAENLLVPECSCHHEVGCSVKGSTVDIADKRSVSSAHKVFYKPLDTLRRKSDESDYVSNYRNIEERKHMTLPVNMPHKELRYPQLTKLRQRKSKVDDRLRVGYECEQGLLKHKTRSTMETYGAGASSYATTSYHSLAPPPLHTECPPPAPRTPRAPRSPRTHRAPCSDHRHVKHDEHADGLIYDEISRKRHKARIKRNKSASPQRHHEEKHDRCREEKAGHVHEDKVDRRRKDKSRLVDQDYITEIIQKQYKPTKVFGRKDSEISQFSVPVCRDQEYSFHDSIIEGTDLCSCCYDREPYRHSPHRSPQRSPQYRHHHHDCRSMCDTRLYSTKRARASRRYRHVDIYNDSTLYDVVPVKEKPSPKSRRKFVEDDIIGYEYYKEVPPSPRTHRPRLNLKAQHHVDYEEYMLTKHANKSNLPARHRRQYEYAGEYLESDELHSDCVHHRTQKPKQLKPIKVQTSIPIENENNVTLTNLHGQSFENEQAITSTDNTLNKTQDTDASDKTDKALCEIKDILQCFLQEIKKEATPTDKDAQATDIPGGKGVGGVPGNVGVTPVMGAPTLPIVPSYTVAQCSVPNTFPPFNNPCCYPMMPMCPMNCMQSSYPPRSASCTCHAFPPNKDTVCQECSQKKVSTQETDKNNETDELIKEIYKFVTLNPNSARKKSPDREHRKESSGKKLTSRSVGDSARVSRHDANVATSAMKCYSKSCEAIGSRMITETSYTTTQSDTVLEKLSLDVSRSDSELTTEVNVRGKSKPTSKFTSVLRSIGLFKKKKTDTESSFEVDIVPKEKQPPFRQDIYDYAMYEQEYYQQPPMPYGSRYDQYGYIPPPPGCEHRGPYYTPGPSAPPGTYTPHRVHEQTIPEHEPHYHHSRGHPSAPPYHDPYYNPPQGPLCLKEIEVKSTGTQSERKMSFLRKLGRRTPPGMSVRSDTPPPPPRFTEGTQTAQKSPSEQNRPLFPGWKKFQEKVQKDLNEDPLMYGYKTKQKLMEGDKKLKTAMVKKMFYKRNPFSPNNLIIRTLLGNDPSSFGEPNVTLKPRIFF